MDDAWADLVGLSAFFGVDVDEGGFLGSGVAAGQCLSCGGYGG